MKKPDNPLAYPMATVDGYTQEGATLRDVFAGQALIGLLANHIVFAAAADREGDARRTADLLSKAAFIHADAMLKARAS